MSKDERIIHIRIPGYQEHQKDLKNRRYLAMDTDFFSNRKIREAKRTCLDSIYCYQWLWANIDYETESLEIKESSLKFEWMDICASQSNRFDLQKRLDSLSHAGLIEVQFVSKSTLNESEIRSNKSQTSVQSDSNDVLTDLKSPLEPPETQTALRATKTNKLTKETYPPTPQGVDEECGRFEEFFREYPRKEAKAKAKAVWQQKNLDALATCIISAANRYKQTPQWTRENGRYIPLPASFLEDERWDDEIPDVRTAAKGPSFDEKIFNAWKDGKALRWSISNESFPAEDLTPCNTVNSALSTLNGFTMPDGTRATYREFVIANE